MRKMILSVLCLAITASMGGCGYVAGTLAEKAAEQTMQEATVSAEPTTERPDIQVENYFLETKPVETSQVVLENEQLPVSDLSEDEEAAEALAAAQNYLTAANNRDYEGLIRYSNLAFMSSVSSKEGEFTDDSLIQDFKTAEAEGYDINGLMEEKFGDTMLEEMPEYIRPSTEREFKYIKQFMSCEGKAYQIYAETYPNSPNYIQNHTIDKMYTITFKEGDSLGLYVVHLDGEWRFDCGFAHMIAFLEDGTDAFMPEE